MRVVTRYKDEYNFLKEQYKALERERDSLKAELETFVKESEYEIQSLVKDRNYDKHDLILERDKLRDDMNAHIENNTGITIMLLNTEKERDALKAENEKLKQDMHLVVSDAGKDLIKERDYLKDENQTLRERLGKLREGLNTIRLSGGFNDPLKWSSVQEAKQALAEDEKHET